MYEGHGFEATVGPTALGDVAVTLVLVAERVDVADAAMLTGLEAELKGLVAEVVGR